MGANLKTNKIIELRKQGMTYEQIRKQLNVNDPTIAKVLKENNMLKNITYTPQTVLKIKSMLSSGYYVKDIAKEIGTSYAGLSSFMVKNKIRVNRKSKNKELVLRLADELDTNQTVSKTGLSADYVRTVRYRYGASKPPAAYRKEKAVKMLNEGKSIDDIAKELGVLPITIVRYIKSC